MTLQLTAEQVWEVIEKELFAVLGMVTANGEARTAGIVYIVRDRKFYISTKTDAWKTRHVAANPHVSLTIPIAKRIPIMPWIKIPQATITFSGLARVMPATEASADLVEAIFQQAGTADILAAMSVIEVTPQKEFVTYGIGIPLSQMRYPEKSRGRAPVT